jgi:hypothetical protein
MIIETLRQRRWMLRTLDALVDFFAMNGNIFSCADADEHLVAFHANDGHGDIVTDHKSLANPSCQYQHGTSLSHYGMPQGRPDHYRTTPVGVARPILRKSEYRVNAKAKSL